MKKRVHKKIIMKPLTKVLMTITFLVIGLFLYHFSKVWGEEQTKMTIILCALSWFYLFFVQTIFIYFIWE